MKLSMKKIIAVAAACLTIGVASAGPLIDQKVEPLKVKGEDFINRKGEKVRMWGFNLVSLYPDKKTSENTAKNLASLGVNCVRLHHMMRPGRDWNPNMTSGALMDYKDDSRTPDPEAWDKFDYLNAELRKNGIYLMLAVGNSRMYKPGDVVIKDGGAEDNKKWSEAISEINSWHWKKSHDVKKMLPLVDERVALINEEFARNLLTHKNPYNGKKYGSDSQVITMELLNEFSMDYAVICKNKFPEYFHKQLQAKWDRYTKKHKVPACDFYKLENKKQTKARAAFMWELQQNYFNRLSKVIRATGFKGPIAYSNLWRGEWSMHFAEVNNGYVEDHAYSDPRIAMDKEDFFARKTLSRLADKPYIIGELNRSEWGKNLEEQKLERATMLPATAAYGAFNNWAGVMWFAWNHGGRSIADTGWAKEDTREAKLGDMVADSMMLDHFRTSALIYRKGLVSESVSPVTIYIPENYVRGDYHGLVKGMTEFEDGWQSVHALKKSFAKAPAGYTGDKMLEKETPAVLVSDTGELKKDTTKQYFTISAPLVETFTGNLKEGAKVSMKHLQYSESDCYAAINLVSVSGKPLKSTKRLLLSKTIMVDGKDSDKGFLTIKGLKNNAKNVEVKVLRPRENYGTVVKAKSNGSGSIAFPVAGWNECVISIK